MEIGILREFIAVALSQNLTAAAKELHFTQSTLSRHMADLEEELSCQLFNRDSTLTLTDAGVAALNGSVEIIGAYDRLLAALSERTSDTSRMVLVEDVSHDRECFTVITEARRVLAEKHPDVVVRLKSPSATLTLSENVRKGVLDIGFLRTFSSNQYRDDLAFDGLDRLALPVCRYNIGFAIRRDSPLAARSSVLLSDLASLHLLTPLFKSFEELRTSFTRMSQAEGFVPQWDFVQATNMKEYYMTDPGPNRAYIYRMDDCGLISDSLANDLVVVDPMGLDCAMNTSLLFRSDEPNEAVVWFIEAVQQAMDLLRNRL